MTKSKLTPDPTKVPKTAAQFKKLLNLEWAAPKKKNAGKKYPRNYNTIHSLHDQINALKVTEKNTLAWRLKAKREKEAANKSVFAKRLLNKKIFRRVEKNRKNQIKLSKGRVL